MPELVTLGETMVVFDSVSNGPLRYASNYTCHTGGAETNVAVGVVRQGHTAGWISSLGNDEFGLLIQRTYMGEGVDLSKVIVSGEHPTGIFFRQATGNGEFKNFYYRKNSAASLMTPDMLDEDYIAQAKIFHVSGITLAISDQTAATAIKAMEIAKRHKVTVCFDPNLRLKMWTLEKAQKVINSIWPLVDIALPGLEEGALLLGVEEPDKIAEIIMSYGVRDVIIKTGAAGAVGYTKDTKIISSGFKVESIVDAFGAGDSFTAGIISGELKGWEFGKKLQLANAIGAMVVSTPGNIEAIPTYEEVQRFLSGKVSTDR